MTRTVPSLASCGLAALAIVSGCASTASSPMAQARLAPTRGNSTEGVVNFTDMGGKLRVTGEVRGLKPNAEHGFHVHEKGDCSSADGTSAGGHFNPDAAPHGQAGPGPHHAGDLPSLRADGNGVARIDATVDKLTVREGSNSVIARALIVHRDPDDYRTQPTGNSGARIACGVIGKA